MPVAPQALSNRPIVLPDHCEVALTVISGRNPRVNCDMQSFADLLKFVFKEPIIPAPANTVVFIPDTDGDLASFETFPSNIAIRFRVTTALRATNVQLRSKIPATPPSAWRCRTRCRDALPRSIPTAMAH